MADTFDRSTYIGGSDIAAILGLSPWRTPLQLYNNKVNPQPENIDESKKKFFARRKKQEPIIAEMLKDEYGINVTRLSLDEDPNRYVDDEFQFMAAEIDFEFSMDDAIREAFPDREDFCAIPDGSICNGEIKTVHPFKAYEWGEQGSEEVPIHYAAQIMWGLGIKRRPGAICAALFGLDGLVCFPIMPDWEVIAAMRQKAVDFWINHIEKRIPPDPLTYEDVLSLYKGFNSRPANIDQTTYDAIQKLNQYREQKKLAEESIEILQQDIALAVFRSWGIPVIDGIPESDPKDAAALMFDGKQVASWNRTRGTYLDQKKLKAEQPDVVKKYTVEHFYRQIRVKKEKS